MMIMIYRTVLLLTTLIFTSITFANPALTLPPPADMFVLKPTADKSMGTHEEGVGITKGTKVTEFSLVSHNGKKTDMTTLLKQSPLLVVFYRGGWCPYCNLQIRELTKTWPEFQQRGVTPVLISADSVEGAALASTSYDIPFPVLSDSDLSAHKAFDVVLDIDDENYKLYQSYGIELEAWSGKGHHKISVPSVFLVDSEGTVLWAHASKDYETRPSATQLLSVIDQLKK